MNKSVTIDFTIPDNVTEEEFKEWFKYKIGWGDCSCDNPLCDEDISDIIFMYNIM